MINCLRADTFVASTFVVAASLYCQFTFEIDLIKKERLYEFMFAKVRYKVYR